MHRKKPGKKKVHQISRAVHAGNRSNLLDVFGRRPVSLSLAISSFRLPPIRHGPALGPTAAQQPSRVVALEILRVALEVPVCL